VGPQMSLINADNCHRYAVNQSSAWICVICAICGLGQVAEWSKARAWRARRVNIKSRHLVVISEIDRTICRCFTARMLQSAAFHGHVCLTSCFAAPGILKVDSVRCTVWQDHS
jgi:hypothetical protein